MKPEKIIALAAALITVITLYGCNSSDYSVAKETETAPATEAATVEVVALQTEPSDASADTVSSETLSAVQKDKYKQQIESLFDELNNSDDD